MSSSAAEYVAAQLREVGIALDVTILSNSELRRRARSGAFDGVLDELVNSVAAFRHSLGPGNSAGYENAGVIEALDSAAQAVGPERVDEWLVRASRIFARDVPLIFLAPKVRHSAVHERVRGLEPPFQSNPILNLHKLWIEAPERELPSLTLMPESLHFVYSRSST